MFHADQYELLDFGQGRKLERIGDHVLDRPAPAAEGTDRANPTAWNSAHARYDREAAQSRSRRESDARGTWSPVDALPDSWTVSHGDLIFELRPTPFGHVGLFPEQAENWDWLAEKARQADRPIRVLNLFAYTGGATLAAAAAGAEVTHVDAARNVVAWARRNAELSNLAEAPIRWIAEDATAYVRREQRRGARYDAIVLDPPSYGHGPQGQRWKLPDDLPALLAACARLTADQPQFMLLTAHTPEFDAPRLRAMLKPFVPQGAKITARPLVLTSRDGRKLNSGVVARWPG
jgi:23S rRNA (cytosine1962-C5)-methyltransferase